MLTIGVLSDTHGSCPGEVFEVLDGCDFIIHAGDIGRGVLEDLRAIAPVIAVLGNNDYPSQYPGLDYFASPSFKGVRFLVSHTPVDLTAALRGNRGVLSPGDPLPHVAIHGHTHVPNLERGMVGNPGGWLLCPVSVSRPRGGSKRTVAKIVIDKGAVKSVKLIQLGL